MRQVKYKRPPGFVDPFAKKPEPADVLPQPRVRMLKPLKPRSTVSHVDRLRAQKVKGSKGISHGDASMNEDDQYGADNDFLDGDEQHHIEVQVFEGNDEYDHDSFYQEGETHSFSNESRFPLASVSRQIRVIRERTDHDADPSDWNDGVGTFIDGNVECILVNQRYIILTVVANDGNALIQCEAELKATDLSMLSDSVYEDQIDPSDISELASQMVENVELKIDELGLARLILNLINDFDDGDSKYESHNGDWDSTFPSGSAVAICATEEELQEMLLPGTIM